MWIYSTAAVIFHSNSQNLNKPSLELTDLEPQLEMVRLSTWCYFLLCCNKKTPRDTQLQSQTGGILVTGSWLNIDPCTLSAGALKAKLPWSHFFEQHQREFLWPDVVIFCGLTLFIRQRTSNMTNLAFFIFTILPIQNIICTLAQAYLHIDIVYRLDPTWMWHIKLYNNHNPCCQ